jgi:hypothetical protein
MLPPIVELPKQEGVDGAGAAGREAADEIGSGVYEALTARGMSVANPFTADAFRKNGQLEDAVAGVQRKFDEVAKELYKKPKDVPEGRFTLGDSVGTLNTTGNADALVIVRSKGFKSKAKAFLLGGLVGLAMSFDSWVGVIDARTGDILYLSDFQSTGIPKAKIYEKAFQKIPVSAGPKRIR